MPPPHGVHCEVPGEAANEPGEHGEGATEPVEHELPGGHCEQSEAATSCEAFEYVPALHSCGRALPVGQKRPAGQGNGSTVAAFGQ